MNRNEQRKLLGRFIRAHRERTLPGAVSGRRRTPGLRREELAARAGISTTWCAWLEQGRDVSASPHVFARIATALAMTRAERAYLFELAGRMDPYLPQDSIAPEAPYSIRMMIQSLRQPAYGLDRAWNACCWNEAAQHLFIGWLSEGRQKNLLRFMFLEPSARRLVPDWAERSKRLLAEFRADYGRHLDDPHTNAVVEQLRTESEIFASAWEAQEVVHREGGIRIFNHPEDGGLAFRQITFTPTDRPDHKLVILEPVDFADAIRTAQTG